MGEGDLEARRELWALSRSCWVWGEAPGSSRPKGTASQALPYKCSQWPILKGQQLRAQAEKATAPCQEPLAGQWTQPVLQLASDKGPQGQNRWPHGPLGYDIYPNQVSGKTGKDSIPVLGTPLSSPTQREPWVTSILWPARAFGPTAGCGARRLLQWDFPYKTEHSY